MTCELEVNCKFGLNGFDVIVVFLLEASLLQLTIVAMSQTQNFHSWNNNFSSLGICFLFHFSYQIDLLYIIFWHGIDLVYVLFHCFELQQYFVKENEEKSDLSTKPVEVKNPKEAASEEAAAEQVVEATSIVTPAATEESSEVSPAAQESNSDVAEESNEATTEETSGNAGEENSGDQEAAEETPEIKVAL